MTTINSNLRDSVKTEYSDKLQQGTGFCAHQFESAYGYSEEELASVAVEATGSSFGCANPLSFGAVKAGDTLVDLGSGAGMDVILAAQKVGPTGKVIGVDMTDEMVDKARQNIQASGVEAIAEIRRGLIESLPVESESVDWVISNCVISLSPEKDRVFSEIARVLKPGGKMLLTDMVMEPIPKWMRRLIAIKSSASAKALDEKRYIDVVKASGLTHIELKSKLVYDALMLQALIRDELAARSTLLKSLLRLDTDQIFAHLIDPFIDPLSKRFEKKVASIKVYAEKPGKQ